MARILFDVTFSRTQRHPAGIPRTVARLHAAMARLDEAPEVIAVSFHAGGWRRLPPGELLLQPPPADAVPHATRAAERSWWIETAAPWVSSRLPHTLRCLAVAGYQQLRFDRASRNDAALEPRAGDILLLADASWNYPVWRAADKIRSAGGHVVLMVHDIMPLRRPGFNGRVFNWQFQRWLERMLPRSDAVLCNSRATQDDLRAWVVAGGPLLPPTDHFRLGSDAAVRAEGARVRPQLAAFMRARPCFAGVGAFEPKRNYGWLLDTFERLWDAGVDAGLVIVGRPTEQCAALLERFRAHPEQGRRLLTLFDADDADVAHIYEHARALVLASLFEGFGLPLVEARTQACPVIANDLPAFRELADAGVALYPQGDRQALEELLRRHFREGRPAVPPMAPFTWEDSARKCLSAIDALLRQRAVA